MPRGQPGRRGSRKVSPESDGRRTAPEREYEDYLETRDEEVGDETPDVVLDVPVLNVEELNLGVEDLRVHVSARAEIADLVKINVGVEAFLGQVKLEIKGIEAQALLKVKLDRILDTLDRALAAIDRNPQILDRTLGSADRALKSGEETVGGVADTVADVADGATGRVARQAERASDETSEFADLQIEEEYVDEQGRIVGRARDEAGNVVEEILDQEGNVLDQDATEEPGDQRGREDEEAEATDAARRKAEELGVDLSGVKGTGSGGRILVKDVEKAARG